MHAIILLAVLAGVLFLWWIIVKAITRGTDWLAGMLRRQGEQLDRIEERLSALENDAMKR